MIRIIFAALCALAAMAVIATPALAQSAQDMFERHDYLDTERDDTTRGAHDSTTGSTQFVQPASLNVTPLSLHFGSADWQSVTVSNTGGLPTSTITESLAPGGYDIDSNCDTLLSGQSCSIRLRPNDLTRAAAVLTIEAQQGGSGQVSLSQPERYKITYPGRCDECPFGWFASPDHGPPYHRGHPDCSGGCPGGATYLHCTDCYAIPDRPGGTVYAVGDAGGALYCGAILNSSYQDYIDGASATEVSWSTPLPTNGWSGHPSQFPRYCERR